MQIKLFIKITISTEQLYITFKKVKLHIFNLNCLPLSTHLNLFWKIIFDTYNLNCNRTDPMLCLYIYVLSRTKVERYSKFPLGNKILPYIPFYSTYGFLNCYSCSNSENPLHCNNFKNQRCSRIGFRQYLITYREFRMSPYFCPW